MPKIIHLIEIPDCYRITIRNIKSCVDNKKGRKKIEDEFKKRIKEHWAEVSEHALNGYVCDGFYEDGEYWLGICGSKIEE